MAAAALETVPLRSEQDIVLARKLVRTVTQELGFSLVDQTKIITAASELARNALIHGKGGEMVCEKMQDGGRNGIRLTFSDKGPGIADLGLALTDGWTTGGGLGLGLSGSKRLVHDFDIQSAPGKGTTVTIARWR